MEYSRRILDPIHSFIVFSNKSWIDECAWHLLNMAPFQRLRRIKQLGFSDFVFPGATHSRFSHSIGVFHMARKLADIAERQSESSKQEAKKNNRGIAQLVALLHDLGHGPFSHAFEISEQHCGSQKPHEEWTLEIIKHDETISSFLEAENILEDITNMLSPQEPHDPYRAIVASQFDADRLDYLQRDRYMSGVGMGGFDCDWLLECLAFSKENGFSLQQKSQSNIEEYLLARYYLHLNVYNHKAVRGIEMMLTDILFELHQDPEASGLSSTHPLRCYYKDRTVSNYLALDDMVVWQAVVEMSEHAKNIKLKNLAYRLYHRKFYKCFDVSQFAEQERREEQLEDFLKKLDKNIYRIDQPTIRAYKSEDESIKIGDQDITELSPIIKAMREKHLCRIYAAEQKSIDAAKSLWKESY